MISPLDFFNALTQTGKIAILTISCVVIIVVGLMFKTLRKAKEPKFIKDTKTSFIREKEPTATDIIEVPSAKAETVVEPPYPVEEQFIQRKPPKIKPKKVKSVMKLSGICDFCGKKIGGPVESKKATLMPFFDPERVETSKYATKELLDLPFVCNFCKGTFCLDHRLPEQHDCKKLRKNKVSWLD